jgi:hypothetical protein
MKLEPFIKEIKKRQNGRAKREKKTRVEPKVPSVGNGKSQKGPPERHAVGPEREKWES